MSVGLRGRESEIRSDEEPENRRLVESCGATRRGKRGWLDGWMDGWKVEREEVKFLGGENGRNGGEERYRLMIKF